MQTPHTLTGSERTDEALLLSVRGGDIKSFGELYERYYGRARAIAYRHTSDAARVDDIVSEAFARILQALKNGKGPHSYMGGYLATTIAHLAGEYGMLASHEVPSEQDHLESMGTLDETVMKLHESDEVISAFTSLPERWQTVLWMTEIEAKKPREVAAALNLSPNAVSALAIRARESLKEGYLRAHQNSPTTPECNRFSTYISSYVRGSLSQKRSDALRSHMGDCPHCTAEYLYLVGINKSMRSWVFPVLSGLSLWTTDGAAVFSTAAIGAAGAGTGAGAAALSGAGASSSSAAAASFSVLSPKTWGSGAQLAAGAAAVTAASIAVASGAMLMGSGQGTIAAESMGGGDSMSAPGGLGPGGGNPGSQPTPLGAEFSDTARASEREAQNASSRSSHGGGKGSDQLPASSSGVALGATAGAETSMAESLTGAGGGVTQGFGSVLTTPGVGASSGITGGESAAGAGLPSSAGDTGQADSGDTSGAVATAAPDPGASSSAGPTPGTSGSTPTTEPGDGGNTGTASPTTPAETPGENTGSDTATDPTPTPTPTEPTDDSGVVPGWYGSAEYLQWYSEIPWSAVGDSSLTTNRLCVVNYVDATGQENTGYTYLPQQILNSQYTNYTLAAYFGWQSITGISCV